MYKLILIEDDLPVLKTLNKIISGMDSDFEITGAFTHPHDAIKHIEENHVDAVITDIQLPEMTGIEFAEYCRRHFPHIKTVILSAYDNFEYAQKAIDLEIVHYVLKPITLKKIETMLEKLSGKISASASTNGFAAASQTLNRRQTILNLLSGFYDNPSSFFDDMRKNDVLLNPDSCRVCSVVMTLDNFPASPENPSSHSREEFYTINSNIVDRNGAEFYSVLFNYSENRFTVFIFAKLDVRAEIFRGAVCDYLDELALDAKNILNMFLTVNSAEYFNDTDAFCRARRKSFSYDEQAENIISYIYENDFEAAVRCVETLGMIFDKASVKPIYLCILSHLAKLTKTAIPGNVEAEKLKNLIISDINNIKRYNLTNTSKSDIIETACRYINENFAKDITLNDVAKHVFLSPIYFSAYFKKKTGERYIDYLQSIKLKKARELLEDTNVKIPTIAEMSGFRDTNYFHKIFKNQTGLTPSEYRKEYKKK